MPGEKPVLSEGKSRPLDSDTGFIPPLKSNLRLLSNVYPRQPPFAKSLAKQFRGIAALKAFLASEGGGTDIRAAARRLLTPAQQAQLAYETNCLECGAMPEGPVCGEMQMRCPLLACATKKTFARFVNIEIELLDRAVHQFAGDYSAAIQKALFLAFPGESFGRPLRNWRQVPVRLSRTQHYLYCYEPVEQFSCRVDTLLRRLLEL